MSRMFLSPRQVDLAESHDFCVDSELRHHLAALIGSWLLFSKPIQELNDNCPYPQITTFHKLHLLINDFVNYVIM